MHTSKLVVLTFVTLLSGAARAVDPQDPSNPQTEDDSKKEAADHRQKPALPPGVIAQLNGRSITVHEYGEYLLASIGESRLGEYIDRLLIEEKARELGVVVTNGEVEALVDERLERTIQGIYRGDREAFLAGLRQQNTTLEDRKSKLFQQILYDQLLEKLILKTREVTPELIRQRFEKDYGPDGVRYRLRHILISTGKRIGPAGEPLPVRSEAEAEELANTIHRELLAGGDFVALVKRYSDDTFTARRDGEIPLYREGFYGREFHESVLQLSKDSPLSGVVRSRRGFHIIQLIDKESTDFESKRAEIAELVRTQPSSARERHEMVQKLRAAASIVR